jgi:hypothetical protein
VDRVEDVDMGMFMRGDEFVRLADRYFPDGLGEVMHASPGAGRTVSG